MPETSLDLRLGPHQGAVEKRLARWDAEEISRRIWEKDHRVWAEEDLPELTDRLGWLEAAHRAPDLVEELAHLPGSLRKDGLRSAVVLGMGGSSLAPEVLRTTFRRRPEGLGLRVLDSTHPEVIHETLRHLDLSRTVFVVASKSGTTVETLSLFRFFWDRVQDAVEDPGRHFVAVTDPGSPLEELAGARGFREVFQAPPEVGGRYSALTPFGLVPATLADAHPAELARRGRAMAEACGPEVAASRNPALRLGAALGELALAGRDKLTLLPSPALESFPLWIEQLVAESTGKDGTGIVPVAGEPVGGTSVYGEDRVFVRIATPEDTDTLVEERLHALEEAGQPVIRIELTDTRDLGGELFRWEMAVAAAGAVLGINPFDQPDVELAKELSREALEEDRGSGDGGEEIPEVGLGDQPGLHRALGSLLETAETRNWFGIQAWFPENPETAFALERLRLHLRERTRLATCLGFGPRYLHSTGQLHKGGPDTGLFLQLVDDGRSDLAIPEEDGSFRRLLRAQAQGDARALLRRERRFLRVHLGEDPAHGLGQLLKALDA